MSYILYRVQYTLHTQPKVHLPHSVNSFSLFEISQSIKIKFQAKKKKKQAGKIKARQINAYIDEKENRKRTCVEEMELE